MSELPTERGTRLWRPPPVLPAGSNLHCLSEFVTWVALALEDVRPVREYPKSVELRRCVMSWRPVDCYRLDERCT